MALHSGTLAWKIPWTEESGRLQSMGHEELDTTERLHFHFSLSCIGERNGNLLQCSCLENLRDGGAWWAAIYGVAQSRTRLKRRSSSSRKRWAKRTDPLMVCLQNSQPPQSTVALTMNRMGIRKVFTPQASTLPPSTNTHARTHRCTGFLLREIRGEPQHLVLILTETSVFWDARMANCDD